MDGASRIFWSIRGHKECNVTPVLEGEGVEEVEDDDEGGAAATDSTTVCGALLSHHMYMETW